MSMAAEGFVKIPKGPAVKSVASVTSLQDPSIREGVRRAQARIKQMKTKLKGQINSSQVDLRKHRTVSEDRSDLAIRTG